MTSYPSYDDQGRSFFYVDYHHLLLPLLSLANVNSRKIDLVNTAFLCFFNRLRLVKEQWWQEASASGGDALEFGKNEIKKYLEDKNNSLVKKQFETMLEKHSTVLRRLTTNPILFFHEASHMDAERLAREVQQLSTLPQDNDIFSTENLYGFLGHLYGLFNASDILVSSLDTKSKSSHEEIKTSEGFQIKSQRSISNLQTTLFIQRTKHADKTKGLETAQLPDLPLEERQKIAMPPSFGLNISSDIQHILQTSAHECFSEELRCFYGCYKTVYRDPSAIFIRYAQESFPELYHNALTEKHNWHPPVSTRQKFHLNDPKHLDSMRRTISKSLRSHRIERRRLDNLSLDNIRTPAKKPAKRKQYSAAFSPFGASFTFDPHKKRVAFCASIGLLLTTAIVALATKFIVPQSWRDTLNTELGGEAGTYATIESSAVVLFALIFWSAQKCCCSSRTTEKPGYYESLLRKNSTIRQLDYGTAPQAEALDAHEGDDVRLP